MKRFCPRYVTKITRSVKPEALSQAQVTIGSANRKRFGGPDFLDTMALS
jgi:hypothetical protein